MGCEFLQSSAYFFTMKGMKNMKVKSVKSVDESFFCVLASLRLCVIWWQFLQPSA